MQTLEQINDQLKQPLDVKRVCKRAGAGKQEFSYLETHDVINHLNVVFGFGGWSCVTTRLTPLPDGATTTCFVACVKLTLLFGDNKIEREGTGFGTVRSGGYELGAKEAESDALKRAARTLGDQFANSLYEKDAPEHQGQQRDAIATTAQLNENEELRKKAVALGLKLKSGSAPEPLPASMPADRVKANTERLRAYIEKKEAKEPSTARAAAFMANLKDREQYDRFFAATQKANLSWGNDDDLATFEAAATPKAGAPIVVEDLTEEDWGAWALLVENGDLRWGA